MDREQFDARLTEIAALDQPLRRDLYALLAARGGSVSRDEAAAELAIPRSVAAFHLDKLAEAGLLEIHFERPAGRGGPGAGRPAKRYRRSGREVSISLPERKYDLAGQLLSDAVAESVDTGQSVERTLAEAARRMGTEIGEAIKAELPRTRSTSAQRTAAITALRRLGYEPREQDGEVVLANCPFHSLAERHRPLICGINLELLEGVTEGLGTGKRLVPRLEPTDGQCCVRLGKLPSGHG